MVAAKKKAPTRVSSKLPGSPAHPLYGRPILEILKGGNLAQMKKMATSARAHIKQVEAALAKLEAGIQKGGAKTAAKTMSRR